MFNRLKEIIKEAAEEAIEEANARMKKYYHVTEKKYINNILKNGFKPSGGSAGMGTYLWETIDMAHDWLQGNFRNYQNPIILAVYTSEIPDHVAEMIHIDSEDSEQYYGHYVVNHKNIWKPNKIEIAEIIEEANAVGAGQIVGSQSPLSMDMNPSHKLMWRGTNPKKAIKNSSNIKEENTDNITITKPNTIEEAIVWFNHNKDKDLRSLRMLVRKSFNFLGAGETREVFTLGNKFVIKIAQTDKHKGQNKSEVEAFQCAGKEYLAEIFEYDREDYKWLIMERVDTNYDHVIEKLFSVPNLGKFSEEQYGDSNQVQSPAEWFSFTLSFPYWKDLSAAIRPQYYNWFEGFLDELQKCVAWHDLIEENIGYRRSTGLLVLIDYANR